MVARKPEGFFWVSDDLDGAEDIELGINEGPVEARAEALCRGWPAEMCL